MAIVLSQEEIALCKPYDSLNNEGCLATDCLNCPRTFLCKDCEQNEVCDKRYKPKILPANREALSNYALCRQFHCLPSAGGLSDQPYKMLLQFEIIADELSKIEQRRLEKDKDAK